MKIFIESIDRGIWNAIVNGQFVPMTLVNDVTFKNSFDELNGRIAKNIITFTLNLDECFRVSQCSSVKEMWDIL